MVLMQIVALVRHDQFRLDRLEPLEELFHLEAECRKEAVPEAAHHDRHVASPSQQLLGAVAGFGLALTGRREDDPSHGDRRVPGDQAEHRTGASDLRIVGVGPDHQEAADATLRSQRQGLHQTSAVHEADGGRDPDRIAVNATTSLGGGGVRRQVPNPA